ncbi:hypothetical protein N7478_001102 [Penicillium angulare]|uniref:uncharacterized protein n=1 Tax=Penicillium angulare TaxID=116970 RepID=UPI0025411B0F|nr:uncharacterized protein N7478_001102 [Penicillium angulare]KAJ5291851.1 hypothetical protein N7478_001102 [Penicillium angulare]
MTSETRKSIRSGSSTGAPGVPSISRDQRNQYDPATTGYNSATGAGYKIPSASSSHPHKKGTEHGQEQEHYRPITPTKGYDAPAGDDRISHAPSTADRVKMEREFEKAQKSRSHKMSEHLGGGINGVAARIHGAGESLRGALNATVDRAFGSHESAEWNEEIARRGEHEYSAKEFSEEVPRRRE